MAHGLIISPLLLGLSSGVYCFAHCIPFVAPIMVSEEHSQRDNMIVIFKFIAGRFMGYLFFGAVVGYLGKHFLTIDTSVVVMVAMVLLSLLLILHVAGFVKKKESSFCTAIRRFNRKIPLLMGFLMGANICTPFLLSLTYVFTLQSPVKGMIYFMMFFAGTSVYFVPPFFLGYLGKIREFQWVGRISGLVVGLLFFAYGIYHLIQLVFFHSSTMIGAGGL